MRVSLLLCLALGGCLLSRPYLDGRELAAAGRPYEAAVRYLEALDQDPDDGRALRALGDVASEAYGVRLGAARAAEEAQSWATAREGYEELTLFVVRLGEYGAGFDTMDLAARIAACRIGESDVAYAAAEAAESEVRWAEAVEAFRRAEERAPGHTDATARLPRTFESWAKAEEAAGRWRSAAQRLLDATTAGDPAAAARAAVLYAALGNAHMWGGNCRQAVRDLRAAEGLTGPSVGGVDLEVAEACAQSFVVVSPFENPAGDAFGVALAEAAADALSLHLRETASPFLSQLERDAMDQLLTEQRASADAPRLPRAHWLVIGKLTEVHGERSAPEVTTRTAAGRLGVECEAGESDGGDTGDTSAPAGCVAGTTLQYEAHVGRAEVVLAGSVRVVDARTGVQAGFWPLSIREVAEVRWADGLRGVDDVPVAPVADARPGVGALAVDATLLAELAAARDGDRALPAEGALARRALDRLGTEAAALARTVVDAEVVLVDPMALPGLDEGPTP